MSETSRFGSGRCSVCSVRHKVSLSGAVWAHSRHGQRCPGSGKSPARHTYVGLVPATPQPPAPLVPKLPAPTLAAVPIAASPATTRARQRAAYFDTLMVIAERQGYPACTPTLDRIERLLGLTP